MLIQKCGIKYIIKITDIDSPNKEIKNDLVLVKGLFKVNNLASVNTMYLINDSRKSLNPELKEQRRKILYQLECMGLDRNCIPEDCKLTLEMGYYVTNSINLKDLDNFQKFYQDTLAKYFNFNDSRIYNLAIYKRTIKNSDKCVVHFRIKKFDNELVESSKIDMRLLK